jgi:fibrillarin-like rRNA methylase
MLASSTSPIICCASALELQNAITFYVKPGSTVLELGAELGDVSSSLCDAVGTSGRAW